MSAAERSGWRDPDLGHWHHKHSFSYPVSDSTDLDLSRRHRQWGRDCPGIDIDWLFIEYDNGYPIAVIDYKLRPGLKGEEPSRNNANSLALSSLCTVKGSLPFFVVFYVKNPWAFRPIWINDHAKQLMPKNVRLSEVGYVNWLYWLRDRNVPLSVISVLDNQIPIEGQSDREDYEIERASREFWGIA